jgi:hypothetical protein
VRSLPLLPGFEPACVFAPLPPENYCIFIMRGVRKVKSSICLSVVMGICCLSQLLLGVTVTNPAYKVETYISYDTSVIGRSIDFTFDSSGNIYVTHTHDNFARNGSVQKIDTNKNVTVLRDDLVDPKSIIWGWRNIIRRLSICSGPF